MGRTVIAPRAVVFEVPGDPVGWAVEPKRRGPHTRIEITDASDAYQARIGRGAWLAVRSAGGRPWRGECVLVHGFAYSARHRIPDTDKIARNLLDGLSLRSVTGEPVGRTSAATVLDDDRWVDDVRIRRRKAPTEPEIGLVVVLASSTPAHRRVVEDVGRLFDERHGLDRSTFAGVIRQAFADAAVRS